MAKSEKKISVTAFEKAMKGGFTNTVTEQWHGLDITIRRSIPLVEMLAFVKAVTDSCFDDELGFIPEIMDFLVRDNILTRYANFNMPDNLEKRYELVYCTDAVDTVLANINRQQLQEIVNSINRKVEYMCNTNAHLINREMGDILKAFDELQEKASSVFDGVSVEDLNKLVAAVEKNGGIDEKRVIDAIMEHEKDSEARRTGTE